LADPTLGTDCRHDAEKKKKKPTRICKKNPKIFLLGHNKNLAEKQQKTSLYNQAQHSRKMHLKNIPKQNRTLTV